jgi:hypothetical protein
VLLSPANFANPVPQITSNRETLGAIRDKLEVGVFTYKKRAVETFIMSMLQLVTNSTNLSAGKDNKSKILKSLKGGKNYFHRVEYTQPLKHCHSQTEKNHEIHLSGYFLNQELPKCESKALLLQQCARRIFLLIAH